MFLNTIQAALTDVYRKQLTCQVEKQINSFKKSKIITHTVKLSDEDVSQALEYLFIKCIQEILKGPVSGFAGLIPHPSLESRINRNH